MTYGICACVCMCVCFSVCLCVCACVCVCVILIFVIPKCRKPTTTFILIYDCCYRRIICYIINEFIFWYIACEVSQVKIRKCRHFLMFMFGRHKKFNKRHNRLSYPRQTGTWKTRRVVSTWQVFSLSLYTCKLVQTRNLI